MANIMEVAWLADVSHQTVSRVLTNENTVRPRTRARVEGAIRKLRYRPSSVARALATRKAHTLRLVSTGSPHYDTASMTVELLALFGPAATRVSKDHGYRGPLTYNRWKGPRNEAE